MLVFVEEGKLENLEKNPRNKDENQQQTQPMYDVEPRNAITRKKYMTEKFSCRKYENMHTECNDNMNNCEIK